MASNPVLESIRALQELPLIRGELVFVLFSFGIFRAISISNYNRNLCPQASVLCSRPWRYIVFRNEVLSLSRGDDTDTGLLHLPRRIMCSKVLAYYKLRFTIRVFVLS